MDAEDIEAAQQDTFSIAQLGLTLMAPTMCLVLSANFSQLVSWLPQPLQPYIYTAASEAVSQQ